jgi:hypothetical protein
MGEPSWPVVVDGKKGSYLLLHRIPEVDAATCLLTRSAALYIPAA